MKLRFKFLLPILLGGFFLSMAGGWLAYQNSLDELREQLVHRASLLTATLQETELVINDNDQMRFILDEITNRTDGVYGITLAAKDPLIIWASSFHPDTDLDSYTQDMLKSLTRSMETGIFGWYLQGNGDLVFVSPLRHQPLQRKGIVDARLMQGYPDNFRMKPAYQLNQDEFRGMLYLRFDWQNIKNKGNTLLIRQSGLILFGFFLITLLSMYLMYRLVVSPMGLIAEVISQQHQGNESARTQLQSRDEVGELARTLDSMLETLHQREHQLRLAMQEQDQIQQQLIQAQKMEALGQMVGGVAHDFNNLLGIILGYTSMAEQHLEKNPEPKMQRYLAKVDKAGNRASRLVQQMLAFSRNRIISEAEWHDINMILHENLDMLSSILSASIKLKVQVEDNLPQIRMDANQFSQLILNLTVNAKDAMPQGGILSYTVKRKKHLHAQCAGCFETIKGDWIELMVEDDGQGMSVEVVKQIFEPFFTTKAVGQGTGLGLSMVYGIVHRHQGHILVYSVPGAGSRFHILLPVLQQPVLNDAAEDQPVQGKTDSQPAVQGRLLLVDDEEDLAQMLAENLRSKGYEVTSLHQSIEAIKSFEKDPMAFDLVVTDQTMPQLNGFEMIQIMRALQPALPVILCSGYSENLEAEVLNSEKISFMSKPVELKKLVNEIEQLLGAEA